MKLLIVNAGSSSLKFQLFQAETEHVLMKGLYDGIGGVGGDAGCVRKITVDGRAFKETCAIADHENAIEDMLSMLAKHGVIQTKNEIDAVGHRIVHGGERYKQTTRITSDTIDDLKRFAFLAPLHNPINISCVEILTGRLPSATQFAIFDTAFHQTMPESVYLYALPMDLYKKHGIRKYGFHGTSHRYVSAMAARILNRDIHDMKIVTCHLGNGQSICAVKNGASFDTSMGFTPLEGLPMGTRSGSFDPEIIMFLLGKGYTPESIQHIINKESGLLGVSGISSDHRAIEEMAAKGNPDARRANDLLVNRITCAIGASAAEMGGIDAIVFTGGIGEHSSMLRKQVLSHFSFLGLELDEASNDAHTTIITAASSRITAMVIPTNEELQMVREVMAAM